MVITVERLLEEALSLSGDSRLVLAERLIESVPPDSGLFDEQLAEAASRAADLEAGAVQGIEGVEALRQVREAVSQRAGYDLRVPPFCP
jgi:putative addiction module component (TIGR02574 family)